METHIHVHIASVSKPFHVKYLYPVQCDILGKDKIFVRGSVRKWEELMLSTIALFHISVPEEYMN